MIKKEDTYKIGRIGKPHGLGGEVVFNFTDDIFDNVDCDYLICEIEGILVPFFFEEYRFKNDSSAIVKFEGIDSVEQARQIVGADVYFEKKFVDDGGQDDVSLEYFVGFTITEPGGTVIGTIVGTDVSTDNWLFIVRQEQTDGTAKTVLIPAHEEFINEINQKNKTIEMDLPAGLLNL